MSQQKPNSINVQASLEQSTEAARKFVPQVVSTGSESEEIGFKDGDGGGGSSTTIHSFNVEVAKNGFSVRVLHNTIDIEDELYIAHTIDEVVELLKSSF